MQHAEPVTATTRDRLLVARVLHRFGFGPAPGEYSTAVDAGAEAVLAAMLAAPDPQSVDDTRTPMPQFAYVDQASLGQSAANQLRAQQERALLLWWLDRMVTTTRPLPERMTWFWHGHWATSNAKVRDARLMLQQNATLRAGALGDFPSLAKAMLRDPAMLLWLDGNNSRKGHPNENLAREFMELFALGRGNYTETDVREAARALTGWRVNQALGTATLRPTDFDATNKTVLGTTANLDVSGFVDVASATAACPRFLASRLWQHSVSNDEPTDAELAMLAAASGPTRSAAALVSAAAGLLTVSAAPRPLAKSPVLWLVGILRALGLTVGGLPPALQQAVVDGASAMGQLPFSPPNVSGWPSGAAWFSPTAAQARFQLTQRLASRADLTALASLSPRTRPDALADLLGVHAWTPATHDAIADPAANASDAFAIAVNAPDHLVGV